MDAKKVRVLPEFSFAFQPIINAEEKCVVSYEALVRGPNGESAFSILGDLESAELNQADETFRAKAIMLADRLNLPFDINLNLAPGSVVSSLTSLSSTCEAAELHNIDPDRVILEVTEHEIINNVSGFVDKINEVRSIGMKVAIDDFGAGYAGLNLLADFQPDFIKIDIRLVHGIESKGPRQAIVRGILRTCLDLGIDVIAEGVETIEEYWWFRSEGVEFFQGYLFAKPGFESLPVPLFFE